MINPDDRRFAEHVFIVLCLVVFALCVVRSCARAQDSPAGMVPAAPSAARRAVDQTDGATVTLLLRAAVAENDWSRPDAAATWHVHKRRAERAGVSLQALTEQYVSAFKIAPTPRLRWVMELEPSCSQPPSWPSAIAWSRWQPKCRELVSDAYKFLRGELPDPCPRATNYGSPRLPQDLERAGRALAAGRWVLAKCSAYTASVYYREVRR